ncbi:MAG: hypothetical protein NTZ10_04555 [Candidatus Saganbacteria bacterium]|nr:hypothetical protein [Candidatus Saganbacteria bacterium]
MKIGSREVFDCLEVAFDLKKVLFVFLGAAAAFLGAMLLLWLGNIPKNFALAVILQVIAAIYFYIVMIGVCGGTSIMVYKELTTGEKLSVKDAMSFSTKNLLALALSPVVWLAVSAVVLLAEYAVFMIGKFSAGQIILSLLTVPVILLNAFLLLFLLFGTLLLFEIIAVDGASALSAVGKLYALTKKAPLQILMCLVPVSIVGVLAGAFAFTIFLGSNIISLVIFGSASGLFAAMAAVEIPSFSPATQAAWAIFSFFVSILSGLIISYLFVFLKTSCVSIYMSVKERIK